MAKKYEQYYEKYPYAKEKIEKTLETLETDGRFTETTARAARELVQENMVYSSINGKDAFVNYMNMKAGDPRLADFVNRFGLYDDNKTVNINPKVVEFVSSYATGNNKKIIDRFKKYFGGKKGKKR